MNNNSNINFVNNLLSAAFTNSGEGKNPLREKFQQKLLDSGITINQAAVNLKIDHKQLEKILDGKLSQLEIISLEKIADFLEIPRSEVSELYFNLIRSSYEPELKEAKRRSYILNTFDLAVLKKIKFIDSISDLEKVEARLLHFFNLKEIQDYKNESVSVAYSSGARKSKSGFAKALWFRTAQASFDGLENPYSYDRDKLFDFIPYIRWHSQDVKKGLFQVVRSLFKLGVTVVYVPTIREAHVRGATFSVNGKPGIAISDYTDFFPTLWFVLLHELFHVLFDWEEILINTYHISGDDEFYSQKENEANDFARKYFASDSDLIQVGENIRNAAFINLLAEKNNVHPSFYYVFYAYQNSKLEPTIWGKIRRFMPDITEALGPLVKVDWDTPKSLAEVINIRKKKVYNL